MRRMKCLTAVAAVMAIGIVATGCTAQEAANFVAGAQTACQDAQTGIAVVVPSGSSMAAHNSTGVNKVAASCAAIDALPPGALAPIAPVPVPSAKTATS